MDQEEVDLLDAEVGKGPVERLQGVVVVVEAVVQLAGDEDVVARNARIADRFADALLVAVHLRGVDVAVSDLECGQSCFTRVLRRNLEDSETQLRDGDSVVQCDVRDCHEHLSSL